MKLGVNKQFVRMQYIDRLGNKLKHYAWIKDDSDVQAILERYGATLDKLAAKTGDEWKMIYRRKHK